MKRIVRLTGVALAAALFPLAAQAAATGYITDASGMAAGPGNYPSVAAVPGGAVVNIIGCESSFRWCDIVHRDDRGWVPAERLQIMHEGRPVALLDFATRTSVPVVNFEFSDYWDSNYRSRDFYRERARYERIRAEEKARMDQEKIDDKVRDEITRQEVRRELREEESRRSMSAGGRNY